MGCSWGRLLPGWAKPFLPSSVLPVGWISETGAGWVSGGWGVFFRSVAGSTSCSKCLHCNASFVPDPRNRGRQRSCAAPECRQASKRQSQAHWAAKPVNADYFKGPSHVERVRGWRAAHPGYWKRSGQRRSKKPERSKTTQPVDVQQSGPPEGLGALQDPCGGALQDSWDPYPPVLVGLIALQTGVTLQEDIRLHLDRVRDQGLAILRQGAGAGRFP